MQVGLEFYIIYGCLRATTSCNFVLCKSDLLHTNSGEFCLLCMGLLTTMHGASVGHLSDVKGAPFTSEVMSSILADIILDTRIKFGTLLAFSAIF